MSNNKSKREGMFGADYYQWGSESMWEDETKSIDWGVDFRVGYPIRIEVWDYDFGWYLDKHDLIEVHWVPNQLTHGTDFYHFDGDEASYTLALEVLEHRR